MTDSAPEAWYWELRAIEPGQANLILLMAIPDKPNPQLAERIIRAEAQDYGESGYTAVEVKRVNRNQGEDMHGNLLIGLRHRLADRIHGPSEVVSAIEAHAGPEAAQSVAAAIDRAKAANVPWISILRVLLPILLAIFTGGALDIPAIIAAILQLLPAESLSPAEARMLAELR